MIARGTRLRQAGLTSRVSALVLLGVILLIGVGLRVAYQKQRAAAPTPVTLSQPREDTSSGLTSPPPAQETRASRGREVYAAWYDVPSHSLARRRAGEEELTAAHNSLPLGTCVRVTHLANGRSVTVRITDRGITHRRVKIDLCKEAAEELDMVGQGIARVRMEIVPEELAAAATDPSPTAAQQ